MSDSLTATLKIDLAAALQRVLDLSTTLDPLKYSLTTPLTNGTGANQADVLWHDVRTLADGANENIDLAGSLTDSLGRAATYARVKFMIIVNKTGAATLRVKPGASNGWATWIGGTSPYIPLPPGAFTILGCAGATAYPVAAGTGDILNIANVAGDGAADYAIILVGASA